MCPHDANLSYQVIMGKYVYIYVYTHIIQEGTIKIKKIYKCIFVELLGFWEIINQQYKGIKECGYGKRAILLIWNKLIILGEISRDKELTWYKGFYFSEDAKDKFWLTITEW